MTKQASKEFFLDTGDGHKLYCAAYGPARGIPLLLIHGGAGHIFDIDRLNIPENRRIVVMHQRGMGKSLPAGETRNNTIDANIIDIERVREHLKIKQMDIFAWSFGAVYMAGYAFRYPQHCKSLTAYAPYFGSNEDYQIIAQKNRAAAKAYYDFHGSDDGHGIATSAFNKASNPDYNRRFQTYHAVFSLAAQSPVPDTELLKTRTLQEWKQLFAIRHAHAALDYELFSRKDHFLKKTAVPLTCPVTLIYGEKDVWSAPHFYATSLFSGHKSFVIPGIGHDVHEAGFLPISLGQTPRKRPAAHP